MSAPFLKAAVMGWPISHSLSPRLHGFWLKKYGISGSYDALPVTPDMLQTSLRALPAQEMRGVNLTVPHKESACAIVDTLDDAARRIGAVNLVTVEKDGKLHGRNTDAYGCAQNLLSAGFKPGGTAFILGAGGASRAVIVALITMGFSSIRIANRTLARAEKLAQEFSVPSCKIAVVEWSQAPHRLDDVSLLINTTSLGMAGQEALDFPLSSLPLAATVTDIVYTPLETPLLQSAKARGHKIIDGLGMLLHQARPSFKAFFDFDPEVTQELRDFVLAGKTDHA